MIALVDMDIVAFRSAASAENDPVEIAILRTDKLMRDILQETEADSYMGFLSGPFNFREDIYSEYKANRKDVIKPRHLDECNLFLLNEWNAQVTTGYEADDALGMYQCKYFLDTIHKDETIICSIDKDLLQIPGFHYNFVKKEAKLIDELEGLRSFYRSALIGDTADNIIGVKGIGKVKASKLIDDLYDERDMYNTVCQFYKDVDRLEVNMDLLWIWRNINEKWSDRFPH